MPINLSPQRVQEAVHQGVTRLENFRRARMMFLKQYVGPYYDQSTGNVGDSPLNMIYNAVRVLIPNLVLSFPEHNVSSRYLASQEYAELLGMALSFHDRQIDIRHEYAQAIVDAVFTLGILKTGLAESDSVYAFDETDRIDTGEVYTECVDFENLVVDPRSQQHLFADARFIGDRLTVPRQVLLDSGLYRNKLIEKLPSAAPKQDGNGRRGHELSSRELDGDELFELEDEVEIIELWVPRSNALVTIPGSREVTCDKYLRVTDYYGPKKGPYTFLALSPPVPKNPLPVPPVGVWYDLAVLANRMASKIVQQAERQKDIVTYSRGAAEDAIEMQEAGDGEAVAVDDPQNVKVHSFGGQAQSNEVHLAALMQQFNMFSSNPQALSGNRLDAGSATEAKILAGNADVGLEYLRDQVYVMAEEEAAKRAWYFHTDPLINVPLIRRVQEPAVYIPDPVTGQPFMVKAAEIVEQQVFLTPEARRGEWLDFTFKIEPDSMGRVDKQTRMQQAMEFMIRVVPSIAQTAMIMAQLGLPFSPKIALTKMAKYAGIDWIDQVFYDPEFQQQMQQAMLAGPQPHGSQGTVDGGLAQNGQFGNIASPPPSPDLAFAQNAQQGANPAQSQMRQAGSPISPY